MTDEPTRITRRDRLRAARRARAATGVAATIVVAGVVAAALVVVRGGVAPQAAHEAIAAPPSFGAALPVRAPAPAGRGIGSAEFRDPSAVTAVLAAATDAIQTLDSFDYRHLERDRAAGDATSTGAFRARYDAALTGGLATAARAAGTVQQAVVQKIGISGLSADRAGVLAFGRLQIRDRSHPDGTSAPLVTGVRLAADHGHWRVTDMTDLGDRGSFAATPPGTPALRAAVTSGAAEVVDLLSYSRQDFDADFNRALDGLTRALRIEQTQRRPALQQGMTTGGYDFAGLVRSVGIESASGNSVLLLVCATGYRVGADGSAPASGTERFEVGVTRTKRRWLVSEFLALPSSG